MPEMGCDPGDVHQVLFTVPYMSETQPMEKVWAKVKNYVASVHKRGRTTDELRADVITGFYGSADCRQKPVTAGDCQKFIGHAKKEVDGWIRADAALRDLFPAGVEPGVDTLSAAVSAAYTAKAGSMVIPIDSNGELVEHPALPDIDLSNSDDAALAALIASTNAMYGAAAAKPKRSKPRGKQRKSLNLAEPVQKRAKTTPKRRCAAPAPYD